MKLEDQVVSLELSKELKELGYPQESLWYWWSYNGNPHKLTQKNMFGDLISAPTVAELGEALPTVVRVKNYLCCLEIRMLYGLWSIRYSTLKQETPHFDEKNMSNAFGRMWIHLEKNGLI